MSKNKRNKQEQSMPNQAIIVEGESVTPEVTENVSQEETTPATVETEPSPTEEVSPTEEETASPVAEAAEPPVEVEEPPVEETVSVPSPVEEIKVVPTVPAATVKTEQVQENPRVRQFKFHTNEYITLCATQIQSQAMLDKKIAQFATIIRSIINTNDTKVYDAAYTFFKEHRNDILSEETVFRNVHKLPSEMFVRVQTVYTTMRGLVEANINKRPFAFDYGLIRDNMKLPAQHPFLSWVRTKLGK